MRLWGLALWLGAAGVGLGQRQVTVADLELVPLMRGTLNVWVAVPGEAAEGPRKVVVADTYHEQTAGSLGQSAGSVGQSAGSLGQTAGSVGVPLDGIAGAAAKANGTIQLKPEAPKHDKGWDELTARVAGTFRQRQVSFEYVGMDELEGRLRDAASAGRLPDVVLVDAAEGSVPPGFAEMMRPYAVVTLGRNGGLAQSEQGKPKLRGVQPVARILLNGPHLVTARAFAVWLGERPGGWYLGCAGCRALPEGTEDAVAVAQGAMREVLTGTKVGAERDEQFAEFDARAAQAAALGTVGQPVDDVGVRLSVAGAAANERFAVVGLRGVVGDQTAFGVTYGVVVLRVDEVGQWRVLQVTDGLSLREMDFAYGALAGYGAKVKREEVVEVKGISQAAPVDGDGRGAEPELWWDNLGGQSLEVVEWQRRVGDVWLGTDLFFVPDGGAKARTQVTGRFADAVGGYRWRVWSVGRGGVMTLSDWKRMTVVAR